MLKMRKNHALDLFFSLQDFFIKVVFSICHSFFLVSFIEQLEISCFLKKIINKQIFFIKLNFLRMVNYMLFTSFFSFFGQLVASMKNC